MTQAEHPHLPEWIAEERAAVAALARQANRAPMHSVTGIQQVHGLQAEVVVRHLEARTSVRCRSIEPHGRRVAAAVRHDVGAPLHVECGAIPAHAVLRRGHGGPVLVAGHVPHLEQPILRVVEHPVAEHRRRRTGLIAGDGCLWIREFPRLFRTQYRVGIVVRGGMKRTMQAGFRDQKIVDEQLPADVDADHWRRRKQIRRRLGLADPFATPRRPRRWQHDPVVQDLAARRQLRADGREPCGAGSRGREKLPASQPGTRAEHRPVY